MSKTRFGFDVHVPGDTFVAISRWPDRKSTLAFGPLPEYSEVTKLRDALTGVEVILVES